MPDEADTPSTLPADSDSRGAGSGTPPPGGTPRPGGAPSRRRTGEADLGPLPRRLGRYEVLERIGSGGMGTVFRARQVPIDRIVALKILAPELARDGRYVRRFVREARAAGSLDHPNIVQVHDVGRAEGHPYICMEHVAGTSVERMLRGRGRLPLEEAVSIAIDVARALEYAHRAGVVHRDIKPDNILVDPRGRVKLADLGLARRFSATEGSSATREGVGMGTPHYMSLEQARDARRADARSDIYSLGATLYHMVTGRVPFEGESAVDILMRAAEEPLRSPAELAPEAPPSLVAVVGRMMAKEPGSRYQDATSLLADLEAVRNELAGLGAARLVGRGGPVRPAEGAGRMLVEISAAVGALVLAGLAAVLLRPGAPSPSADPLFRRPPLHEAGRTPPGEPASAVPADGGSGSGKRTKEDVRTPAGRSAADLSAGDGGGTHDGTRGDAHGDARDRARGEADQVAGQATAPTAGTDDVSRGRRGDATEESPALALRRSRWYERAGRYGDAAEGLRTFAAEAPGDPSAGGEPKAKALREVERLYERAGRESAATLEAARRLVDAGRFERAVALLRWALASWGLPVLEARAEDALKAALVEREAVAATGKAGARAESYAREKMRSAEKSARGRSFAKAAGQLETAIRALEGAGAAAGGALVTRLRSRRRAFEALASIHRAVRARLVKGGLRIPARDVFRDWPKDAVVRAAADPGKVRIEFQGALNYVDKRWEELTPEQYARLAERCARKDRPAEMLGAGFAWYEAGHAERAITLWKRCPERPLEASTASTASGASGASKASAASKAGAAPPELPVAETIRRALALDGAGREREALSALAALFRTGAAPPDEGGEVRRLVESLARDVDASCGLVASVRAGPAEAEELQYEMSGGAWRGDWEVGAARLRQAEHAVVSPSGGTVTLTLRCPFASAVELACSVRFLEEAGAGVAVSFVPDEEGAAPAAGARLSVEDLVEDLAGVGPGRTGLVRRPLMVRFCRRWDEVTVEVARAPGTRGADSGREVVLKREGRAGAVRGPHGALSGGSKGAPRGPEKVVVALFGWTELRSVRLRGVVEPDWREHRRRERLAEAEGALARALEEKDAALRARALEQVRAEHPDCRRAGLRATRRAAEDYRASGDRLRAEAARLLAERWFPDLD